MSVCFSGSLLAHTCINCNYFLFVMLCWKIKYDDDDDVLQGSVLGTLLFTAYISPIGRVVGRLGVKHHEYADDQGRNHVSKVGGSSSLIYGITQGRSQEFDLGV